MRKLIRILRLRAAVRYWRRRALLFEAKLEAERWRNLAREDMFVSASVMGSRGMFGVSPRHGPALQSKQLQPTIPADPWETMLTPADRMEFDAYWKADAEVAGVPLHQARQKFLNEIKSRRQPLNDDPFVTH